MQMWLGRPAVLQCTVGSEPGSMPTHSVPAVGVSVNLCWTQPGLA